MSQSVKFTCQRARADMPSFSALAELNACRRKLLELGVIGVDPKGIGFGNLSLRDGETNTFYITGSATSRLATLSLGDCVRVMESDFKRNWVCYEGTAIPSSESLTHAAIYISDPPTSAVIHCHDSALWKTLLDCASTTSKSIPYGTPQMAYEVIRLFENSDTRMQRIFAMAGHESGIVTFGKNLEEAFDVLMHARKRSSSCVKNSFQERILSGDER